MDQEELEVASRLVGTTLKDKYRLEGVLGIGGMGVVYRGSHRNGNRVAVKIMHPHLSIRTEIRTRFLKEGYTANSVDHDGVVRVLDDDIAADGAAFLVMELLTGEGLDARWERAQRRMPVSEVCDIAHQLLDVLASAHAKGIIHRDLKPENLFITKSGALKVLDFGIARVQHDLNFHMKTRTGTLLGTPAFMPPEQALGRVNEIDGRTDVWAVGATMFTLLTGAFVHDADNLEMLRIMAATQPARSIRTVSPAIPEPIAAVVDKALAFDLGARWADATAMQQALASAHQAVFNRPPPSARSTSNAVSMAATELTEPPRRALAASTSAGLSHTADPPPAAISPAIAAAPSAAAPAPSAAASTGPAAPASPARIAEPRKASSGYLIAAGVVGLFVIAGVGLAARSRWTTAAAETLGTPLVSSGSALPVVQAAPAQPPSAAITQASSAVPPAPAASAPVEPSAQPKAATRQAASGGGGVRPAASTLVTPSPAPSKPTVAGSSAPAAPTASTAPKCEIVYDLDSAGNKVFKKVCK